MKTCRICDIAKPFEEFLPRKDQKDGLHFYCRPCLKVKKAESYQRNREKALAAMSAYRKANPEKVAAAKKRCYEAKPEQYAARAKAKYDANPAFYSEKSKEWVKANRDRYEANHKAYREANREVLSNKSGVYRRANKDKVNALSLRYIKARYKVDAVFALKLLCRRRLGFALAKRGFGKDSKTEAVLGCSFLELVAHLESQFLPGMTWENRGKYGWHVDHRVPLASARDKAGVERLCHYTNLQPLWAEDNWSKGDKMPPDAEGRVWRARRLNSNSPVRNNS